MKKVLFFVSILILIIGCNSNNEGKNYTTYSKNTIRIAVSPDYSTPNANYWIKKDEQIIAQSSETQVSPLSLNLNQEKISILATLKKPSGKIEQKEVDTEIIVKNCRPCDPPADEPNAICVTECTMSLAESTIIFDSKSDEIGTYEIWGEVTGKVVEVEKFYYNVIDFETLNKIIGFN